jgi:hypothetical protein
MSNCAGHPRRFKQRGGPKYTGQSGVLQPAGRTARRTLENQQHRASGLNLLVAAIVVWSAVFTWSGAVQALRNRGQMIPEALLVHLTPLKWEHINLTGDYHWRRDGGLRNSPRLPIAVGMPIAEHPRTDPGAHDSRSGLPPWVFDREAFARPRMKDTDLR